MASTVVSTFTRGASHPETRSHAKQVQMPSFKVQHWASSAGSLVSSQNCLWPISVFLKLKNWLCLYRQASSWASQTSWFDTIQIQVPITIQGRASWHASRSLWELKTSWIQSVLNRYRWPKCLLYPHRYETGALLHSLGFKMTRNQGGMLCQSG